MKPWSSESRVAQRRILAARAQVVGEGRREGAGERRRAKKLRDVCVCVCVCVRERERERERT